MGLYSAHPFPLRRLLFLMIPEKNNDGRPLSPGQQLIREREVCKKDPTTIIRLNFLKIKSKRGELVPFVPNKVQSQVLSIIRQQRMALKPVRLCILKGRQFGISTLTEALLYSYVSQRANLNALIMSDDEDGSNYLFDMLKLMNEEMERDQPHLTPQKKMSNEKKLEFKNKHSQILIDTAKNVDAGRKYTFHLAHLSEASRFRDFDQSLLSLMQSIPELPGTIVIIETTANGEEAFCRFWRRIKEQALKNETNWLPVFLTWKDHDEYQRVFVTPEEKEHFQKTMSADEKDIMATHGLTFEQMNWRRYMINDKCAGNVLKFQQEYPLTDEEAFITSGKRVFQEVVLAPNKKNIQEPKMKGDVEIVNKNPTFVPDESGYLKVFKTPQTGHRYVIAADVSDGLSGGDYSCAQVIDRTTWEQVAIFHGTIAPDIFGQKLFSLGAWYKWALIAPETNASGLVTTLKLRDLFYPNIVHRSKLNIDEVGNVSESDELGWQTNQKTKPIIISELTESLRDILLVIHDEMTLRELRSYSILEVRETGYNVMGGSGGSHDDRVIALAIAVHFAKTLPESTSQNQVYESIHSTRRTGY